MMRIKFPATIHGVISNERNIMPPYFFRESHQVNADAYERTSTSTHSQHVRPKKFKLGLRWKYLITGVLIYESCMESSCGPKLAEPQSPELLSCGGVVLRDVTKGPHNYPIVSQSLRNNDKHVHVQGHRSQSLHLFPHPTTASYRKILISLTSMYACTKFFKKYKLFYWRSFSS